MSRQIVAPAQAGVQACNVAWIPVFTGYDGALR
jgi:hypothetical protein